MKPSALLTGILSLCAFAVLAVPRTIVSNDSRIEFVVREMGVPVVGQFKHFDAAIDIDPVTPEKSSASLRIEIGSLTTQNDEADAIATGADWLDKSHAPYATFTSSSIRAVSPGHFEAKGVLTLRNKPRDLLIQFTSTDQGGKTLISSDFNIARSEFGIGGGVWNQGDVVAEQIGVKVRLALGSDPFKH